MQTTEVGEIAYAPSASGQLSLTVRLLGAGNPEQATLTLTQLDWTDSPSSTAATQ